MNSVGTVHPRNEQGEFYCIKWKRNRMLEHLLFGNLTLADIPLMYLSSWVQVYLWCWLFYAFCLLITIYGKWSYIWHEWITSVDHKKIGIMYLILSGVMLLRGFSDADLNAFSTSHRCWQ